MSNARFTDEQKAIIAHDSGHAIVNAVPGSGKTTVLIGRLRRMIRDGADPSRLLAVMFNKAAQLNFDARLRRALGEARAAPQVRTFHSIGYALNNRLVEISALPPARLNTSRRAMDAEAGRALRQAWKDYHGGDSRPDPSHQADFVEYLTLVKSEVISPADVFEQHDYMPICAPFVKAFELFEDRRTEQKRMYFDDQIYRPVKRLMASPELWSLFDSSYEDILIDELQDISPIQFELMRGLAGRTACVMGVGDPDQAIYGFRGSKVTLMTEEFPKTFAPCRAFPMTRTFRFGHAVALLANHLIVQNKVRDDHLVIAHDHNPATTIEHFPITPMHGTGIVPLLQPYADRGELRHALLVERNFNHGIPFELELAEAGIPYFVVGREPLIFVPEIAAVVCAISIAANQWIVDDLDRERFLHSMLTTPTMYATSDVVDELVTGMVDQLSKDPRRLADPIAAMATKTASTNAALSTRLRTRADAVRMLASGALSGQAPRVVAEAFMKLVDLRGALQRGASTAEQRADATAAIDAFLQLADKSATIAEFLEVLGPLAAQTQGEPPQGDYLTITSIHRSKGLEARLVIVVGLSNGTFPNPMSGTDLEEERRLAFVALTRAIERLALFHPVDPVLDAMRADTGHVPPSSETRTASPYVYEGDTGLCRRLAGAIEDGVPTKITARRDDVGPRYLEAIGMNNVIEFTVPDAARIKVQPLPRHFAPAIGSTLQHAEEGTCKVVVRVHHPVYLMQRANGSTFPSSITPEGGWTLIER